MVQFFAPKEGRGLPSLWFSEANRRWLTGFTGSAGVVLIEGDAIHLFTDGRYTEQAANEAFDAVHIHIVRDPIKAVIKVLHEAMTARYLLFEQDALSWQEWQNWVRSADGWSFMAYGAGASLLRAVKDEYEIDCLQKAALIADEALQDVLRDWSQWSTEDRVRRALERSCYDRGSKTVPFDFIVAQGARSALPHGVASADALTGEPLTIDWGAEYNGYYSDQTVTIVPKRDLWTQTWQLRYDAVYKSQRAGLNTIADGVACKEVDRVARAILEQASLAQYFTHGTGHGVGLQIHEYPRLGDTGKDRLCTGMVVTVEPGVYVPGWGGIRLEDTVVVTQSGCKRLTATDKQQPLFLEQ